VILVDTSVLIDPPESWPGDALGASMISLAELRFGVHMARSAASRSTRLQKILNLDQTLVWVPFDADAAEAYGVLAARVAPTRPAHARSKDIMIAASALARGAAFMTRNARDFALVGDLVEIREVT